MDDTRWLRKKGRKWIITVPPEVREWLGVTHRRALHWHLSRRGEAVLSAEAVRPGGRPGVSDLVREIASLRAQLAAVQQRDERRDRGMYAEGHTHGYLQAYERLMHPDGPSAERGRRRAMFRWAFPDAAYLTDPKQMGPRPAPSRPRLNARTRRAKRDAAAERRGVEAHSLDHYPLPSPSPSPAVVEAGADTSGAQLPGVPLET